MLTEDIKFHPYKVQLIQALNEDDKPRRVEFARHQLEAIEQDPNFANRIFFTDEAHFHLKGHINHQNNRYWSDNPPSWFVEEPLHAPKVTVFAGIKSDGLIVGPYFWEPSDEFPSEKGIGSRWMKKLLDEQIIPFLEGWENFDSTIFMLDGAPAHHSNAVLGVIDESFPGRWMGRGTVQFPSPYPWPARSPDLTPMDYWFWGDLKSKVILIAKLLQRLT